MSGKARGKKCVPARIFTGTTGRGWSNSLWNFQSWAQVEKGLQQRKRGALKLLGPPSLGLPSTACVNVSVCAG